MKGNHKNTLAPALVASMLLLLSCCSTGLAAPEGAASKAAIASSQESQKPVLDPNQYFGKAKAGYSAAKQCPEICSKLFCYCGCDLTDEHVSLLDCFTSDHGVDCYICQEEALVALKLKQQGKGLAEIQKAIDLAYKKEYPFDDKSPAYKKYQASKLWKDSSGSLDKHGIEDGTSSARNKRSTKGSCCGGKTKTK